MLLPQGTSPIYNLMPDILSSLSTEVGLGVAGFQSIMHDLLKFISKERHSDTLVERLIARFKNTEDQVQWRNIAFCISEVWLEIEILYEVFIDPAVKPM